MHEHTHSQTQSNRNVSRELGYDAVTSADGDGYRLETRAIFFFFFLLEGRPSRGFSELK